MRGGRAPYSRSACARRDIACTSRALSITRNASSAVGAVSRCVSSSKPSPQDVHTRAVGAGGLGDLAIRYGYQRFETSVMIAVIVVLIGLVALIQAGGDRLARSVGHR